MNFIPLDVSINFLKKILSFGLLCFAFGFIYPQPANAFQNLPPSPKPAPKFPVTQPIKPKPHITIGKRPNVDLSNVGALPDLKIISVTPKLAPLAIKDCKAGSSVYGSLLSFDVKIKNVGKGVANLKKYMFSIEAPTVDGKTPKMKGDNGYSRARRTPEKIMPGQTFTVHGGSGVAGTHNSHGRTLSFPANRWSELAGKSRKFKLEIAKMGV